MMKAKFILFNALFALLFVETASAQTKTPADLRRLASQYGPTTNPQLKALKEEEFVVNTDYEDQRLGLEYVYIQQSYKGIKGYNMIQSLTLKNNVLQHQAGRFIPNIASKVATTVPVLKAEDAVVRATAYLGLPAVSNLKQVDNTFATDNKIAFNDGGIAKQNIQTELVLASNDDGKTVHLAWNVFIEPNNSSDLWHIRIDAANGEIVDKGNYTVYEKDDCNPAVAKRAYVGSPNPGFIGQQQGLAKKATSFVSAAPPTTTTANYNVIPFPAENPYVTGPTIVTNPWELAGPNNNATTYGWHFDGTTNYVNTKGNNIWCYDDSAKKNAPGRFDTSSTIGSTLNFLVAPNFTTGPHATVNRQFCTASLFYWNNLMHDIYYQYGFDEPAGNMQTNNIGRGGKGGDYLRAEAQDGSGTDNSNMSAQPDGGICREQMYLFTATTATTGSNITVSAPSALAGTYTYVESGFSTSNKLATVGPITGNVVYYIDSLATTHIACTNTLSNNLLGNIALIYRGTCNFVLKVKRAQDAGAIGVIVVNNAAGAPIIMGGTDNSITIPAVMITDTDGALFAAQLDAGQTVTATIAVGKTGGNGLMFDGGLDNSIVCHEFTHAISLRLTGGPASTSCLSNAEQGGEGWSDFIALMTVTDWTKAVVTDSSKPREIGTYAFDQNVTPGNGVRNYPYTTNLVLNPHTYADLKTSSEVHNIGEVWCSALWDMAWFIIGQEGKINPNIYDVAGGGGNNIAIQLVIQGLKLQPCSPGFLDARDAILKADSILYGYAHKCAIWKAFARRGMGFSASQGSSATCGDETVAFDVPPCVTPLPITLLSFTAQTEGRAVFVKWATSTEVNVKDYTVEYSADGTAWESICVKDARNLSAKQNYSYLHTSPSVGFNYYRLKVVDNNGEVSYSHTVTVLFSGKSEIKVYPNPAIELVNAEISNDKAEKAILKITDLAGRVVLQKEVSLQVGKSIVQFNTSKLSKGAYMMELNGTDKSVKMFVKK